MRYALCLSGFMRSFRQSMRHLRHSFLDNLDCDIYVSTWDIAGHSKYKNSTGREPEERITAEMLQTIYGARLKQSVIHDYDPERITPSWIRYLEARPMQQRRVISMYFHIYEANRLKMNSGMRYDVTIRCRPDLFIETNLSEVLQKAPYMEKRVFVPHIESYGIINDQFMFGLTKTMDEVAGIYPSLNSPQEYWSPEPAEQTLLTFLKVRQIEPMLVPMKYVRAS